MSEANSTTPRKPAKPYADFPLFPHAAGYWAKKIRGKLHYLGKWSDADAALAKYLEQKDALHAGRTPRPDPNALTVKDAANAFLNAKQDGVNSGELSPRTFAGYLEACNEAVGTFGKARLLSDLDPADFAKLRTRMARRWGPHRLGTGIQCVRSLFKHAFDAGLIDKPVRCGTGFKRPTKKTMRLHRAKQGPKLFTAEEIHRLMDAAGPQVRAMILLGINCGFGNTDCATLPIKGLDLDGAWVSHARPKTGIDRRCPLWPETVAALRAVLASRPEPKNAEHAGLVFVTKYGRCWHRDTGDNPLTKEIAKLLKALGINGRRGLNFYGLRHTFRTTADAARDQPACDFLMGHESTHMSTHYREGISDDRLQAVTEYVRTWLFCKSETKPSTETTSAQTE